MLLVLVMDTVAASRSCAHHVLSIMHIVLDDATPPLPDWFARRWHHCLVMLIHAAAESLPAGRVRRLRARSPWLLAVAMDGNADIDHPGLRTRLETGQALLVPPDVAFALLPGAAGLVLAKLHVLLSPADGGTSPLRDLDPPAVAGIGAAGLHLTRELVRLAPVGSAAQAVVTRARLRPWADALLATFAAHRLVGRDAPSSLRPSWLDEVVRRLDRDFCRPDLDTSELARWAGLSTWHFLREFRRHMGCTPAAWLRRLRVAKARILLADGQGLSVAATRCGWRDAARLRRQFLAETGAPPPRL